MLGSTIIDQARRASNDTDSTNPFHTDANLLDLLDNWQTDLALKLRYPRKQDTISFALGAGGAAGVVDIDTDILDINAVVLEPSSGTDYTRLKPISEFELSRRRPSWRSTDNANARPSFYVLMDAPVLAAAEFPQRRITTDTTFDVAMTMRVYATQAPAALTAQTDSPIFQVPFHVTAVYYLAWHMLLPRNIEKSIVFGRLYEKEVQRIKSQSKEFSDDSSQVWDTIHAGGEMTPERLSM